MSQNDEAYQRRQEILRLAQSQIGVHGFPSIVRIASTLALKEWAVRRELVALDLEGALARTCTQILAGPTRRCSAPVSTAFPGQLRRTRCAKCSGHTPSDSPAPLEAAGSATSHETMVVDPRPSADMPDDIGPGYIAGGVPVVVRHDSADGWPVEIVRVGHGPEVPTIADEELGARLGFERPRVIRELIRRHVKAGNINPFAVAVPCGGAVPRMEARFYLTEDDALFVTAKSETPKAVVITKAMISAFVTWRRALAAPRSPAPLAETRQPVMS